MMCCTAGHLRTIWLIPDRDTYSPLAQCGNLDSQWRQGRHPIGSGETVCAHPFQTHTSWNKASRMSRSYSVVSKDQGVKFSHDWVPFTSRCRWTSPVFSKVSATWLERDIKTIWRSRRPAGPQVISNQPHWFQTGESHDQTLHIWWWVLWCRGGVSAGAQQAGLHIKWAFDKLSHAITTYCLNFKTAMCEESNIFSFLTNDPDFLRVDVSHSSPPCQTFSPVHTVQVQDLDTHSTCCHTTSTRIRHWDQACNW